MIKHPIFHDIPQQNIILWRYYPYENFIKFLEQQAIHFTRIDQYTREDNFEGTWPGF